MKTRALILITQILSLGLLSEAVNPKRKKNTDSYYRDKYFLSNEGQSCVDISDKRKKKRNHIEFCSVPAPEPDVSTTLSFWGWQNSKGKRPKFVHVYASSSSSSSTVNETLLFEIEFLKAKETSYGVWSDDSRAEWYRKEFTVNSSMTNNMNYSFLKLYYSVAKGKKEELNLRDVWIRPTDKKSRKQPPRSCNILLQKMSIYFFWLFLILDLFGLYCRHGTNERSNLNFELFLLFVCTMFLTSAFLLNFVSPYPNGQRCKNSDQFVVIMVFISLLLLPFFIMFCYYFYQKCVKNMYHLRFINNNREQNQQDINHHDEPMDEIELGLRSLSRQASTTIQSEANTIKIATLNTKTNKFPNREIFHGNENECSICMETYTMVRPGLVTECGHVWCSKCIGDICEMRPPNHSGVCPTCRSSVELKNLILLSLNENE